MKAYQTLTTDKVDQNNVLVDYLKEAAEEIKEKLDSMLRYFELADEAVRQLEAFIPGREMLESFCSAWQWNNKVYQAKSSRQKKHCEYERDFWLLYAQDQLDDQKDMTDQDFESFKQQAYERLDTIVRSSSLVEMVNSLIRPYLNTCKGQITQEMLNLIMFYHNHHIYNRGKRKNKAPIEILTGKKLDTSWLDILLAV